jgi:hypothetical protein
MKLQSTTISTLDLSAGHSDLLDLPAEHSDLLYICLLVTHIYYICMLVTQICTRFAYWTLDLLDLSAGHSNLD